MRTKTLSVRAYARTLGISHTAVQKAIKAGRITRGLVWTGAKCRVNPTIVNRYFLPKRAETDRVLAEKLTKCHVCGREVPV